MTIKYAEGVPIYPKGLFHRDGENKPVPTGEQNPMPVVMVEGGEAGGEPNEGIPYAEGVPIYPSGEFHRDENNEPVATGYQNPMPVYIVGDGGGGGSSGPVDWDAVQNKPTSYPPSDHHHDDRYYTQEQIDEPGFLDDRLDNVTLERMGRELRVKSVDGLLVGVADINTWLQGTEGNIQQQIDGLEDTLAAVTSGMRYRGKFETHAELQGVGVMENGDLAVVLADETRSDARSMYVYRDDLGTWEFIGAFEFSDAFTALSDTPNGYDDGKFLRSTASGIVYGMPAWSDLQDRPDRTKAQIEQAVDRAHEHGNKPALDRIGIDAQGRITIDGVPYVPAAPARQYRYSRRSSNMEHGLNQTIRFDQHVSGNIPITSQGAFTLTAGKTYHVMANVLLEMTGWVRVALVDTETGSTPPEAPNGAIIHSVTSSTNESSNGFLSVIITPTTTRNFGIRFIARSGSSTVVRGAFSTLTIVEI